MLSTMADMGVPIEKHHHEVAPAQHELGMKFDTLVRTADYMQLYKYCVHMVAHAYGKTATFMTKPVKGDNGSGMHVHQSIRSEDHTSELQSLMRNSYAAFCLKQKIKPTNTTTHTQPYFNT